MASTMTSAEAGAPSSSSSSSLSAAPTTTTTSTPAPTSTSSSSSTAAAASATNTTGSSVPESEPRMPELRIKNYVSSANLGLRFDLASLVTKSHRRAELVPKKNCLLLKLAHPRATAMLFASGKLVCTGADSEEGIKSAARKVTQIIQKMDHPGVNLIDFKIQNVVAACEVGFFVLIEALSFAHSDSCTYEPELYPALIYRLEKPKVKILVFVSGKVVFTGSKHARDLQAAYQVIYPILKQFRDDKRTADAVAHATSTSTTKEDRSAKNATLSISKDDDDMEDSNMDE